MTIIQGTEIGDETATLEPPCEGLVIVDQMTTWRRPAWATSSSSDFSERMDHERIEVFGTAEASACVIDQVDFKEDGTRSRIVRWSTRIELWDTVTEPVWQDTLGPYSVEQARALAEDDFPNARPGFAADAMKALAQLLTAIDSTVPLPRQKVDEILAARDAEAAATPIGPCPTWCELPEGHPFGDGLDFGCQVRYHERRTSEHVRIIAIEQYANGVLQPLRDAVISLDPPEDDFDLMTAEAATTLVRELVSAIATLSRGAELAYEVTDGPTVTDRAGVIHPAWCDHANADGHIGNDPSDRPCWSRVDDNGISVATYIDDGGHRVATINTDFDEIQVTEVWEAISEILKAVAIFAPAATEADSGVSA